MASRLCPEELGRRDADDRERTPLHVENPPDDTRGTGEPPLPIAIADDDHRFAILFGQRASDNSVDAEHCVVVAGHGLRQCEFGLTVDTDVRVESGPECGEPRKNVVAEVHGGSGIEREDVPGRTALAEHDEIARVTDGKRPEEDGVR